MAMVDYFVEVLPPVFMSRDCVQIGEPYSLDNEGRETYATAEKIGSDWVYTGIMACKKQTAEHKYLQEAYREIYSRLDPDGALAVHAEFEASGTPEEILNNIREILDLCLPH